MANPFTSPTLSGFNSSPPPSDGTQVSANQVKWSNHIDKIGTPLRNYIDDLVTNTNTAFATVDDASKLTTGTLPDARISSAITRNATINTNWGGDDLAVANGGTGASTAAGARSNLGAAASSHNHSAADITSGTLAVARGGTGQTTMDNLSEQVTLQWTIQADPGGTPSGSPGDVFAYY